MNRTFFQAIRAFLGFMLKILSAIILPLVVLLGYIFFLSPTVFCEGVEGTFPVLHEWTKLTDPGVIQEIKTTLSNKAGVSRFT